MKCFVGLVFFADTMSTFFDSMFLYRSLVSNFGVSDVIARNWLPCLHFPTGNVNAVLAANWIFDTSK
jgi:hypothetical protein